jgi:hypothetical protein
MNVKNFILGIAIIILSTFVVVYGFSAIYPQPQFSDYCHDKGLVHTDNESSCVLAEGKWTNFTSPSDPKVTNVTGYCDVTYYCGKNYDEANQKYSLNRFFISIPLALIIIALGAFLFNLDAVGAGLMGGGVATLIFGISGYWGYANNWFRFLVSLFALVLLIAISYWFNKKFSFGKKKKEKKPVRNSRKKKK